MPETQTTYGHLLTLAETAELLGVPLQQAALDLQTGKFPAPDYRYLNGKGGRPYYAPRWRRDRVERLRCSEPTTATSFKED